MPPKTPKTPAKEVSQYASPPPSILLLTICDLSFQERSWSLTTSAPILY